MKNISLVFQDDVQRKDIAQLKTVRGCYGVSAYKNTVNLYFKRVERTTLLSLTLVVQQILTANATGLALTNGEFDAAASSRDLYVALREEVVS